VIITTGLEEFAEGNQGKYKTIYIDPPWPEYGGGQIRRGANRHYKLMSIRHISELPVWNLSAENSHLYLWTTNNYLAEAMLIIEGWGFSYNERKGLQDSAPDEGHTPKSRMRCGG
jgi:N6-adenosine-specific RNA methylase IME4